MKLGDLLEGVEAGGSMTPLAGGWGGARVG
jgi:hypothetical protein